MRQAAREDAYQDSASCDKIARASYPLGRFATLTSCPLPAEGDYGFTIREIKSLLDLSTLSPPSGEMPKAEGDALAVYFAMNITSELGDIHLSGKNH